MLQNCNKRSTTTTHTHTHTHTHTASQRVEYKLSVLVYRCLPNLAPEYLRDELRHVADISSRKRLRSLSTSAVKFFVFLFINADFYDFDLICANRTANSAVHRRW